MNFDYIDTDYDMLEGHQERELLFTNLIDKSLREVIEYADTGEGRSDALIITDGHGIILHSNKAWEDLCGFTNDEIQGHSNRFLQGPLSDAKEITEFAASVESGLPTRGKLLNYRKSGDAFMNELSVIPMYDWMYGKDDKSEAIVARDSVYQQTLTPSHFISLLKKTRNRADLPGLTDEERKIRDEHLGHKGPT